ncbi:uncharacterized protein DUF177 involved in 23S rRNA accumulation [Prosthecobacter fusiformis]|uniref:Uncharacterized protein DUF177 involved in 23S rRNA accumulation n=1 Tax=Prosthecobacter fusiformis TaxID=48464 RepID=A0A4V3FG36_9BACT|nr:hypothetical protein [Prosthecobacter fusiformis]TDU73163.1 uncharacterized protein DUF177 involved in 23S rRNA accumulation [Prosthecobacter fusiformis]
MKPFQFDTRNLPVEGKQITGTLPASFFNLPEADTVKAESPLIYDLNFIKDDKDIIVTGSLDATFSMECGRCLERFQIQVDLPEYEAEVPIEKETTMDLTDLIREDILLTLPNFPRCEDGNVELRDCPAQGKFEPSDEPLVTEEPGADGGVWNALDQLK